ncbi:MAG TPA: hypothetical protein VGI42_04755 [Chthoniobacterales bacterium]|jgi:hypothetical protein
MPNYGYHLARAEGNATRKIYRAFLPAIARRPIHSRGHVPLNVFSYSGESDLPEQVASIRSFLKHAGRPRQFTIVSDGTHSAGSRDLLRGLDPVISISDSNQWIPRQLPAALYPYLTTHPTGKQLALIMSLPADQPALYVDSDVLFFPSARDLIDRAQATGTPAFYLPDCGFSGDERLLHRETEKNQPVNTGVLLLFRKLDWSLALSRFLELDGQPTFFTNQTMTHLTMHANSGTPLDARKYVLQLDDQFVYSDRYSRTDLALRHYVNPVRHKFWTNIRRGAFSL